MPGLHPLPLSDTTADPNAPWVIVVDDVQAIADFVCEALADSGIPAESCTDGLEAAACIRRNLPRVVILDVQMPGLDGIDLFKQLRGDTATRDIPVIFVAANADKLTARLPDFASMNAALIPKPFSVDLLIDHVEQALGR